MKQIYLLRASGEMKFTKLYFLVYIRLAGSVGVWIGIQRKLGRDGGNAYIHRVLDV
jgi:hypothetical protein